MYDNQKTLIRMFLIQMSLVLHDMIFYAVLSVVKEAVFIKTSMSISLFVFGGFDVKSIGFCFKQLVLHLGS